MKKATSKTQHKCSLCGRQLKDAGTEIAGLFFGPECAARAHVAANRLSQLGYAAGSTRTFALVPHGEEGFTFCPETQSFLQGGQQFGVKFIRQMQPGTPPSVVLTVSGASILEYLKKAEPLSFRDIQADFAARLKAQ